MLVVSKSAFAKMCNVSKGRVTQWIREGKITGAALVGIGRSAMIDSEIAIPQVRERRAVNESCGLNGLNTKLDDVQPAVDRKSRTTEAAQVSANAETPSQTERPPPATVRKSPTVDLPAPQVRESEDAETVDSRIKAEKLKQNEILTRKQEMEETTRYGVYVEAAEARGGVTRVASEMMKIFEGALPDMASAQAAKLQATKFQISQRESFHQLREDFRAIRGQPAAVRGAAAAEMQEAVESEQ